MLSSAALERVSADAACWNWEATTLLVIAYEWDAEHGGPEALATRRLVTQLVAAGARVHVLTSFGERTAHPPYCDATVVPAPPLTGGRLNRARQMVWNGVPDPECLWVAPAVTAGLNALRSLPARTVVYGRAMPGASNIVAWHLARKSGRPWIAHFSDEWPSVQATSGVKKWLAPYKPPLFRLWRRRILRDAGAMTFTNPAQAAAFVAPGTPGSRKAFVVTHLATNPSRPARPQQRERFHIVHSGNLNPPGHSAETLMRGLCLFLERRPAARTRLRFTQAGWNSGDIPEWSRHCGLADVVHDAGRVARADVPTLLDDASLLVGVDYVREDSTTLLSKLPDYFSAGRPILLITAANAFMGRLFSCDDAVMTAPHGDPGAVADCLVGVYDAWRAGRWNVVLPSAQTRAAFSPERVLLELAGALAVAVRGRTGAAVPIAAHHVAPDELAS